MMERNDIFCKSFLLEGNTSVGVLLLHGWTSQPIEMHALGKFLNSKGITVYAPMLTGHGTDPKDLENVRWEQWRDDALKGYKFLKNECKSEQIFVVGMSLGGALALHTVHEFKDIKGIILMSIPYKFNFERVLVNYSKIASKFNRYAKKRYVFSLMRDSAIKNIAYKKFPISSFLEVFYAVKLSLNGLENIKSPCMIIQSKNDYFLSKNGMEQLSKRLGSEIVKKRIIKEAYHNFIADKGNEYIYEEIFEFIDNINKLDI